MKNHICDECQEFTTTHTHEIIYKSQATYMRNIKANQIELCLKHHTGSPTGIHFNNEMKQRWRNNLQLKYYEMFDNEFYNMGDIRDKLECSLVEVASIVKKIPYHCEGYYKEELILRLMGGALCK